MSGRLNLVLVHSEGWQDIADFIKIRDHIEEIAPDIEVYIASNFSPCSYTRKVAARRPTLVFSPLRLGSFQPLRGKVYQGKPMSKLVEMQLLAAQGLPVPAFEEIREDTVLSPDSYGPLLIVKSSHPLASWGQGIELVRREVLQYRAPDNYPENHPGRYGPMIAQKFIDCGYPMTCRVLTLFGVPIFTYCRRSTRPFVFDPRRDHFEQNEYMPSLPNSIAHISNDPEMLLLAGAAYKAMPEVALQACDLLKSKDGGLFLLEVNPGGGTWMFSNSHAPGYRARLGVNDLHSQFDAFRTCAKLLVERTRAEAT